MPVPQMKAANEPKATLKARALSLPSWVSSPIRAPKKGPRMMPMGPAKKPTMIPTIAPREAAFEPPKRLVINTGRKLSSSVTATATTAHTIRVSVAKPAPAHWQSNIPTKQIGVPGKMGTTHPATPTRAQTRPNISSSSIVVEKSVLVVTKVSKTLLVGGGRGEIWGEKSCRIVSKSEIFG